MNAISFDTTITPAVCFFFLSKPPLLFTIHVSSKYICSSAGELDANEFSAYFPAIWVPFLSVILTQYGFLENFQFSQPLP
jgi:hypothetical protein